jgi:hypothetical protein
MKYDFLNRLGTIVNSGESRLIAVTGNVLDLFHVREKSSENEEENHGVFVPLLDFVVSKWDDNGVDQCIINYDLNNGIQFLHKRHLEELGKEWDKWRGTNSKVTDKNGESIFSLKNEINKSRISPFMSLEILKQICQCKRQSKKFNKRITIIVNSANQIVPFSSGNTLLGDNDRRRVAACLNWFSDPDFMNGRDSVFLVTESLSLISESISKL